MSKIEWKDRNIEEVILDLETKIAVNAQEITKLASENNLMITSLRQIARPAAAYSIDPIKYRDNIIKEIIKIAEDTLNEVGVSVPND